MNQFDRRLRALAAKEKMIVPDTLHQRLVETIHTNVPERRYISILRFVVIAALIAILGTVTAGALRLIGNDEMGGYISPQILANHATESENDTDAAESAKPGISATEDAAESDSSMIAKDQAPAMYEAWNTWNTIYQDTDRQKEVSQAAIDAYYALHFWDAEIEGARYEHVQACIELEDTQTYEALVVLYLSAGSGYRMHMDCETMELLHTTDLLPEVMKGDYFNALWNNALDTYQAEQSEQAAG